MKRALWAALIVLSLTGAASAESNNVEIIVNNQLYNSGEITASLSRYLDDVRAQGYNPILTTQTFANSNAVRAHLAGRYNTDGLAGAVFVGSVFYKNFKRTNFGETETFPCDLFFMDLDGTWTDTDSDNYLDTHTGNVAPEIWVGRMPVSAVTMLHSGRTEASLLNAYFDRNHLYRTKQLSLPDNGMAYVDDDWSGSADYWGGQLGASLTGTVEIVKDKAVTTGADYANRLSTGQYESILLCAHSDSIHHEFKSGTGGGVNTSELAGLDPDVFFYNLFACSNCKYSSNWCQGVEYVFGTDMGLLAVGSSKTGSMLDFGEYYTPLGEGATFGEAFYDWWSYQARNGSFYSSQIDWFYGMTLLGDPTLTMQQFLIPEPGTLAMLSVAAMLFARRRRMN